PTRTVTVVPAGSDGWQLTVTCRSLSSVKSSLSVTSNRTPPASAALVTTLNSARNDCTSPPFCRLASFGVNVTAPVTSEARAGWARPIASSRRTHAQGRVRGREPARNREMQGRARTRVERGRPGIAFSFRERTACSDFQQRLRFYQATTGASQGARPKKDLK